MPTELTPQAAAWTTRDFRPEDAPALHALMAAAIRDTASATCSAAQCDAWIASAGDATQFAQQLRDAWVRVASTPEGALLGFAAIAMPGHLELLYTAPDKGRQGVASALLDDLYFLAGAMGAARMTTDASLFAQPFFLKHGFIPVASTAVVPAGDALGRLRMEKVLPALK